MFMQFIKGRTINEKSMNLRALGQALKDKLAEPLGLMGRQDSARIDAGSARRAWLEITHLFLIDRKCASFSSIRGKAQDSMLLEFDDGRAFQVKLAKYSEHRIKVTGEVWVGEMSFENLPPILNGRLLEGISYISSSGNGPQDVDILSLILGADCYLVFELVPGSLRGIGFLGD
jgi:hypothetical protein